MKAKTVIVPSMVGTTAMTIFSYLVAASKDRKFEEPKLLAALVKQILEKEYKGLAKPAGWAMHYTMGCVMALAFQELWKQRKTVPTVKDGLISGAVGGAAGILIWQIVFKICANMPNIPLKRFYGHLFLAHLVFGVTVAITSRKGHSVKPRQSPKIANRRDTSNERLN